MPMQGDAGDASSISGPERSSGEGNGSLLQDSNLGSLMERGASWWAKNWCWGHKELDTTERLDQIL